MKKLKMLTSILLSIVLCLSFVLPTTVNAVGRDDEECSITISNQVTGHKFVAYRIFAAELNVVEGVKTLSDIEFAVASSANDMLDAINAEFGREGTTGDNKLFTTAAEVADYLSGLTENRVEAAVKFATAVYDYIGEDESYELTEIATGDTVTYSVSNIKPGYYLIIDENQDTLNPVESIYSRFILEVAGDVEATAKIEGKPTLDKVVGNGRKDKTTTANYEPAEGMDDKHNTANIGDSVPFKLEINFPNLAEYTSYTFEVKDTLSEGFTFENNVTMKILNAVTTGEGESAVVTDMELVKDTDFTVVESTENPGEITISFNTILDKYKENKDLVNKTIVIEYSATLNENAKGNQEANTNTAVLTYSNNPRTSTTGTTPEKTTETYTYNVTINKVDVKEKESDWGNATEPVGSHVKKAGALSNVEFTLHRVTADAKEETETSEPVPGTYKTNANGQIEVNGLANGTYYLIETVAHDGYNKVLGKIYFTISAKYVEADKKVVINEGDITADVPGDAKNEATIGVVPEFYEGAEDTKFDSKGEIWLLVTNSTGAQLPSTGGIGTVIFTVVGLLVMAAVVVVAVKSNKK